ncbi:MAG: hypothetical protein IPP15_18820 [Saprospiraceae bacterium]|uniref:Uncharacterized protein n=1 Tax=Candidatus Opimibacter skivensis TaxID=2982028 RepID=A0A9D7SW70_9BACT|nr:hypothetical protein [Candidatus Opimibacter skivensis]
MKTNPMISFLLMIIGVTGLGFIAPWWAAAIWIVVIASITRLNKKQAILSGSFAFGLVWLAMALYMSLHDDAKIISKTGALLGGLSTPLMFAVTFVLAFVTGLLSGWLGSALGQTFFPRKSEIVSPEK